MTDEEYQQHLVDYGIPLEADADDISGLCVHFSRSYERGVLWRDGNLIAAIYPEVAAAIELGAMNSGRSFVFVLPPGQELASCVRDALWVEGQATQASSKPWISGARDLAREAEDVFSEGEEALLPLSELCFQDKVVAATDPKSMHSKSGREVDEDPDRHEHDAWQRLRVDMATAGALPMSFVSFDLCSECGATTRHTLRLGLGQAFIEPTKHQHRWVEFASPVPDADGVFASVRGEVCMAGSPPCRAVRGVKVSRSRAPDLDSRPSWTSRSTLREPDGVDVKRGHIHIWNEGRMAIVPGASLATVKCATCRSTYFSDDIDGPVPDEYAKLVLAPVKRAGGFSRISEHKLHSILTDASRVYGSDVLEAFGEILASAACEYGLSEPTSSDVDHAFRAARVQIEGHRLTGWRAAEFELEDATLSGFVLGDKVGIFETDTGWEVVHLGVRRRISFEKGEVEARKSAEAAVRGDVKPDKQAHRVQIKHWQTVGRGAKRNSSDSEIRALLREVQAGHPSNDLIKRLQRARQRTTGVKLQVKRLAEWDEWVVQWVENRRVNDDRSYHTSDKDDAEATLLAMLIHDGTFDRAEEA